MLTIKHVTASGEAIYLGSEVTYRNGFDSSAAAKQVAYLDGKEWKSLSHGLVYVMNETGKTVATYDMNELAAGYSFNLGSAGRPADPFYNKT